MRSESLVKDQTNNILWDGKTSKFKLLLISFGDMGFMLTLTKFQGDVIKPAGAC